MGADLHRDERGYRRSFATIDRSVETGGDAMTKCQYCGLMHEAICHRIKAIEYDESGFMIRRVEFHGPEVAFTVPAFTDQTPTPPGKVVPIK